MSIKEKTIERLAQQLTNLGCKIKIITEDGTEYGDLEIAKVVAKKRTNVLARVDYKTAIDTMKAGDVVVIDSPLDVPIESLRSCITGYSAHKYGAGVFTTAVDKEKHAIEILRME